MQTTHDRLLRLRIAPTGIDNPYPIPSLSKIAGRCVIEKGGEGAGGNGDLVFDIVVEPLVLGVVPAVTVRTIGMILVMVFLGSLGARWAIGLLDEQLASDSSLGDEKKDR